MLDYDITIVDNSLFREWYPNPSDIHFPDLVRKIDESDDFEPPPIFAEFYSNSQVFGEANFISYYDLTLDTDRIKYLDFYEHLLTDKKLEIEPLLKEEGFIELPTSDNTFLQIKKAFYQGNPSKSYSFLISQQSRRYDEKIIRRDLLIIQEIGKLKDADIRIVTKREEHKEIVRESFFKILSDHWHSNSFRTLSFYKEPDFSNEKANITQGQIIEFIVKQCEKAQQNRNFKDIFITAPTGWGKSLLFQIPAIYLSEEYNLVTIVVTPLKALMDDQVEALKNRGVSSACFINSDISFIERQKNIESLHRGEKSILYLSPELLLSYNIREFIGDREIGQLVVDEAHLVSTWGRDFRVDYWYLGKYIRNIRKYTTRKFPVVALTATAVYSGDSDIVFQTIESLNMRLPMLYIGNVRRDEIHFQINSFKYTGNHEESKIDRH